MSFLRNLFGIPDVEEAKAKGNVKGLVKALVKSDKAAVRTQAVEALEELAGPSVIEPLVSALGDKSDQVTDAAGKALVRIGAPAVDPLLSYLQGEGRTATGGWRAALALGQIGDLRAVPSLIEAAQKGSYLLRRYAILALGEIGDARAAPALAAALRDEYKDIRSAAAQALAALGDAELDTVIAALQDRRPEVRQVAVRALGKMGSCCGTEPLIAALQDGRREVRESAARALGRVGDERAIRPLFGAMSVRRDAKHKISGRIGSEAVQEIASRIGRDAVPTLVEVLEDRRASRREVAAEALGKIGDGRATLSLLRVLYGRQVMLPALPKAAAAALDRLQPDPEALAPALQDASANVRAGAAKRLGETKDARAVGPLVERLDDDSIRVRKAVAKALAKLRWKPEATEAGARYWILRQEWEKCVEIGAPATGPLVEALRSTGRSKARLRSAAAQALGKLGWEPSMDEIGAIYWIEQGEWAQCTEIGAPAVDPLIEMLVEGEAERSQDAARALVRIGAPAVEALADLLQDDDGEIRMRAIEALGEIGTPSAVRPLLVTRDRSSMADRDTVGAVREALDKIGPDMILSAGVLADPDEGVRRWAVRSLGRAGHTGAVESLIALLEDEEMDIRGEAADALGQIGGTRAVDALIGALEGKVWESAVLNLCRTGDPRAIDPLLRLLREGSPAARAWTAGQLRKVKDARVVDGLVVALEDPRRKVREKAKAALEKLGWDAEGHKVGPREWIDRDEWEQCVAYGEAAVGPLIDVLNEKDAARRERAVVALGQIGAPSVDPLVRVLGYMGMGSHRRAAAAQALGLIGDARAVPGLVEALRQRDADVRQAAVVALGQIGDREALPWLIVTLRDRDQEVRAAAQQVVDQMGWQEPEPSYDTVTMEGEGEVGFWLSEPTDAETVVRVLLTQHLMENPSHIRIVPNTCDTRGGCFVMFEAYRAPGETEAEYEQRMAADKSFQEGVQKAMRGEHRSARWSFEEAVAWHPYSPEAWNNLAFALANSRDHEEAIECCDVAIELRPDYADPWDIKGRCLGRLGQYREALSAIERFIRLAGSQAQYAERVAAAKEAAARLRSRL